MKLTRRAAKDLVRELNVVRQRFASLETMAEVLRTHNGFELFHRSTLSRWLDDRPTSLTRVAVEILRSRPQSATIRIAENKTLSVIPSSMLQWEIEKRTPHGLLASRYDLKPVVHATAHGNDSFEFLAAGRADVAVIPGDLVSGLPAFCARLCLLSKVYIAGISSKPVMTQFDLKNKRFAVLAGSSFVNRLKFESRNWGFELPPPLILPSLQDCVRALVDGRAQCVAGWEPFVTHARRAVERSRSVHMIPHGVLGWFEMHVAVNLKTAHAGAVRAYLKGLQESVRYTNGRKAVEAFHIEIARRYNLKPAEVRNILGNIIFYASELDAATALRLWEREALFQSDERNNLQQHAVSAR